ncbi:hypothetical protein CSB11_02080 [Candidatus Campbellbacteria bacterium]|nr:MAG: hypothetical protein CSB11_02080 [Candidatus Campbellbacteria bacterium]
MREILVNKSGESVVFEIFVLMFVSFILGYVVRLVYEKFFLYEQVNDDFYDDIEDKYIKDDLTNSYNQQGLDNFDQNIENVDFSDSKKNHFETKSNKENINQQENNQEKEKTDYQSYISLDKSQNQEIINSNNIEEIKQSVVKSTLSPYSEIEMQDLKIVDGVGPKIELLLKRNGIENLKVLSETSLERLNQILDTAGDKYAFHNPASWAEQAELALKGNLNELSEFQDYISAKK